MTTQTESQIAEEVRALLARRKISQRSLAINMGWQQSQISRRLSGITPFTAAELAQLADELEVPVEALYGRPSGHVPPLAATEAAS